MGLRSSWRRILAKTVGRIALAVVAAAIALVCVACASSTSSGSVASSDSSQNESSQANSVQSVIEDSDDESDMPSSESSTSAEYEASIDLSDPKDRYSLNVFLSNFSEVWWGQVDFDAERASAEDLARFAVLHCARNTRDDWEFARNDEQRYDVPGEGGGAEGRYNVRVKADRVVEIVERYFGRSIDYSELSGDYCGPCHYVDGYVYFGVTNGYGAAEGVALAKRVEDGGNGLLVVDFDVYPNFAGGYDPADEGLYSMEPDDLEALFCAEGRTVPGCATLSVSAGEDGLPEFTLLTYSTGSYGIGGDEGDGSAETAQVEDVPDEVADFADKLRKIDEDKAADPLMGGSTREMSRAGAGYVERYEELMGEVLNWLESQPDVDAGQLAKEQAEWESQLQDRVEEVAAESGRGTIRPLAIMSTKMEMLHDRIEELIGRA